MKRRPCVDDFCRKIKIAFYPKREEELDEFKKYFNVMYFSVKGVSLFEDINTNIFNQVPDIIVCTDNYQIISNKIEKYIHYIPIYDYLNRKKEVCHEIRKKAFHNYIDKVKEQISYEIERSKSDGIAVFNIVSLLDLKNEYLKDHSIRVMYYSLMIGKSLGLEEDELSNLKYASLLHDIGKLVIPSKIFSRPANYSDYDYRLYKYHPLIGEYLIDFPMFENVKKVVRLHHERVDGRGYLKRKGMSDIPLLSRIISVANIFDRITTSSFYKRRYSYEEAIKLMELYSKEAKTKNKLQPFDPKIVQIFLKEIKKDQNFFVDMNFFLYNSLKDSIIVEK